MSTTFADLGVSPAAARALSKRGIETPKEDMNIIRARLKLAETLAKELRHENTPH